MTAFLSFGLFGKCAADCAAQVGFQRKWCFFSDRQGEEPFAVCAGEKAFAFNGVAFAVKQDAFVIRITLNRWRHDFKAVGSAFFDGFVWRIGNYCQSDNQVFVAVDALQNIAFGSGVGKRVRIKFAVSFDVGSGAASVAGRNGIAACVHHAPSAALYGGVFFVHAHFSTVVAKCGIAIFKLSCPIVLGGRDQVVRAVGKTDLAVFGNIAAFAFRKIV